MVDKIVMKKEDLQAKLVSQLKLMKAYDAERLAQHRKDEAEYIKLFKAACREASKWDYKTAQQHKFDPTSLINKQFDVEYPGWRTKEKRPACPRPIAPRVELALRNLELDTRKTWTMVNHGTNDQLYEFVTWTTTPIDMSGGCD